MSAFWLKQFLTQLLALTTPRQREMHLLKRRDFDEPGGESANGDSVPTAEHVRFGPSCLHKGDFQSSNPQPSVIQLPSSHSVSPVGPRRRSRSRPPRAQHAGQSPAESRAQELTLVSPHVSLHSLPMDEDLPPHVLAPQLAERVRLAEVVEACLKDALAPGTRRNYSSSLRSMIGQLEVQVGVHLVPLDSDVKLMLAFASLDRRPWGTIQGHRAALRAWHLERSLLHKFDAAWTDMALHFWRGLKKRADHTRSKAKRPVDQRKLIEFQRCRIETGKPAGARDAAAAAFCFYGVRRASEMFALNRSDIVIRHDHVEVLIRKQKNDPCGVGMRCWIPRLPALGLCCPWWALKVWCAEWDSCWAKLGTGHLFCTTGSEIPKQLSGDSWRKALTSVLAGPGVGSHSLRKGGARWWKFSCGLPDEVVQAQGGWATPECMRAYYSKLSEPERRTYMLQAAMRDPSSRAGPPLAGAGPLVGQSNV